jgi:hypothetical protein
MKRKRESERESLEAPQFANIGMTLKRQARLKSKMRAESASIAGRYRSLLSGSEMKARQIENESLCHEIILPLWHQ